MYKAADLHTELKQNCTNEALRPSGREKGGSFREKRTGDQSKTLKYWILFRFMTVFTYLPSSGCLLSQFCTYKGEQIVKTMGKKNYYETLRTVYIPR